MTQEWSRALQVQHNIARYWASPEGLRYAEMTYVGTVADEMSTLYDVKPYAKGEYGEVSARLHRDMLIEADTFYVNEEMTNVVDAAAKSYLPGELHPDELPSHRGFVLFHHPVHLTDRSGLTCGCIAMSWRREMIHPTDNEGTPIPSAGLEPGVLLSLYTDRDDPEDDFIAGVLSDPLRDGIRLDKYMMPKYVLLHWLGWRFNARYEVFAAGDNADWRGIPGTLWALLRQRIAITTQQQAQRATSRQAMREGWKHVSAIKVVTLRRAAYRNPYGDNDAEPRNVDYSHRWIVGGHWRWQWYPTLGRHQRIWIAPYVKGPEDKELIVKRTVFDVSR